MALNPIRALKSRTIDVAVMPKRTRDTRLLNAPLYRDEMVAVVPRGQLLPSRGYVEIRDVANETYVANSTTAEIGREFTRLFDPAGIRPKRVLQAGHIEAVLGVVRAGVGVTVSTRSTAMPFMATGELALLPLTAAGQFLTWFATFFATGRETHPARDVVTTLARITAA